MGGLERWGKEKRKKNPNCFTVLTEMTEKPVPNCFLQNKILCRFHLRNACHWVFDAVRLCVFDRESRFLIFT